MPDYVADRDAAIAWARQVLTTDFVVLDTETTGLDHDDEAVSIGVVSKTGVILLNTLLCHEKPCEPRALAVHGVTWEATRGAPHFREVWPQWVEVTEGKALIGYNVTFDTRIIRQMVERYLIDRGQLAVDQVVSLMLNAESDVMEQFARFYGSWSDWHQSYTWKKLTFAASFLGLSVVGAHGAVSDCLLTLRVVEAMAAKKARGE